MLRCLRCPCALRSMLCSTLDDPVLSALTSRSKAKACSVKGKQFRGSAYLFLFLFLLPPFSFSFLPYSLSSSFPCFLFLSYK